MLIEKGITLGVIDSFHHSHSCFFTHCSLIHFFPIQNWHRTQPYNTIQLSVPVSVCMRVYALLKICFLFAIELYYIKIHMQAICYTFQNSTLDWMGWWCACIRCTFPHNRILFTQWKEFIFIYLFAIVKISIYKYMRRIFIGCYYLFWKRGVFMKRIVTNVNRKM